MALRMLRALRRPSPVRTVLAGVLAPAAATGLATLLSGTSTTIAALVYVLAVVAAAGFGGLGAGLIASVLSFLGLNFFFTPPFHTLVVSKHEDLVALVVFLLVAALVGSLLAVALSLRARAEGREREARLLYSLSTRLLSGERLEEVLRTLADSLVTLFALGSCRIELEGTSPVEATRAGGGPPGAEIEIPIEAGGHRVGRLVAAPAQPGETIGDLERSLLRTFAGQLALALEAARLGTEAGRARLDAEANQVRAALFSSVTHDLRTPLSSIKASVTSLLGGDVTFDERAREELLRTILEETDRLNRLVGNLLDLSRMRSGGLVPAKALAPIGEVVESVVRRLRLLLEGRPLRLTIREDLPEVPMDVVQVDQALSNLLENAVKFSPAGSEIGISAVRWQDSVQVRVSDRGPGIPSEERSKVFQPFYRGASDGGQPGTGLGLAIARAVVSVHGGRIWIEGTPAGGTTAVFELPLTAAGERT